MTISTQKQFSFNSGELSPRIYGNSNMAKYQSALSSSTNIQVGLYGYVTARPGTKYIAGVEDATTKSYLFPFKYSNTQSYILEFSDQKIRFFKNQAQILSGGSPYEISSPYLIADVPNISITQSYDTIYIAHGSYAPRKLVRTSDTSWTLSAITFDEWPYLDTNDTTVTLTPSATTGNITITASSATFASTDVGRVIRYLSGVDDADSTLYDLPGTTQIYFDIPFYPQTSSDVEVFRVETNGSKTELTYNAGTLGADEFKITSGQVLIYAALSSGQQLIVQRKNTSSGIWGYATITAYNSTTSVDATVNSELSGTNASTYWRLGAWSETTGYPKLVTFHDQRLWFAHTTTRPNGLWASAVQDFENFSPDNDLMKGQVDDNTAISVIVADTPTIEWMKAINVLLLGGEGIKSVNRDGGGITPSNIYISPEEATNCSNINPAILANEIIFADYQNKKVRSVGFSFQQDAYQTLDLTLLSDHLFETNQVVQIAYQSTPSPTVWVLRTDGSLVSCTYDKELQVVAWTQHVIGGTSVEVESIAVIPYNNSTELWMTVKRTINSSTKRYVEVLTQPFFNDDKETCIFVDSALTYSGGSTSTLTGLSHLEGQTVTVMTNGSYHDTKTVSSGQITLNSACTKATVGLAYDINGETVPLDSGKSNGSAIGARSRVNEVYMNFYETDGCKVGFDSNNLQEILFRPAGLIGGQYYDEFTGIKKIQINGKHEDYYKIYFEQPYPLPFTIRNITYRVDVSEN